MPGPKAEQKEAKSHITDFQKITNLQTWFDSPSILPLAGLKISVSTILQKVIAASFIKITKGRHLYTMKCPVHNVRDPMLPYARTGVEEWRWGGVEPKLGIALYDVNMLEGNWYITLMPPSFLPSLLSPLPNCPVLFRMICLNHTYIAFKW